MKATPPIRSRSTPPPRAAGRASRRGRGDRKTLRLSASTRRRMSDERAIARPGRGGRRVGGERQAGERPGVGRDVAEEVGGHGVADRVARRRVGRAEPPGERVEPEHDRREVREEVPGQVVAAGMRQLVGEDRPQVVVLHRPGGQEQDRTPKAGETGRRHLGRADDAHGRCADRPGHVPALPDDPPGRLVRAADDPTEREPGQRQPGRQHRDPDRPEAEQRRDDRHGNGRGGSCAVPGPRASRLDAHRAPVHLARASKAPRPSGRRPPARRERPGRSAPAARASAHRRPRPPRPRLARGRRATAGCGPRAARCPSQARASIAVQRATSASRRPARRRSTTSLIVDPPSRSRRGGASGLAPHRPSASARADRPRSASPT